MTRSGCAQTIRKNLMVAEIFPQSHPARPLPRSGFTIKAFKAISTEFILHAAVWHMAVRDVLPDLAANDRNLSAHA